VPKKLTTAEFISKAQKKHKNTYSYDRAVYKNSRSELIITCKIHGDFIQRAGSHLEGSGCQKCSTERGAKKNRLSTKEFITKAKLVHGDKYTYQKTEYEGTRKKVTITCPIHGDFQQKPEFHLAGNNCRQCSVISGGVKNRLSEKEFISRANEMHKNKYDYSQLNFRKATKKVNIICKQHGLFSQLAMSHLNGNGCPKCGLISRAKKRLMTKEEFVERSRQMQRKKYDYSHLKFTGLGTTYEFLCEKHGYFKQKGTLHINGFEGCEKCAQFYKRDSRLRNYIAYFLAEAKKIHNDKYDYSRVKYDGDTKETGYNKKIEIICPVHGSFFQNPTTHLQGGGCFKCGKDKLAKLFAKSQSEFIEQSNKIHHSKYSYEHVEYINTNSQVKIICPEHGEFKQRPAKHLKGQGCPKCLHKGEGRLAKILFEKHVVFREFVIDTKRYDFYLPEYNLLIERDGEQHYSLEKSFSKLEGLTKEQSYALQKDNDEFKTQLAKDNGYKISRIPYWLTPEEEEIEIENILAGKPTYPDVPDPKQEKTKPKPVKN
jgi:very-short-patch-repair endonuclease